MKDEMRKKHEELMRLAAEEMEAQADLIEPAAETQIFPADLGTIVSALVKGPTTFPRS